MYKTKYKQSSKNYILKEYGFDASMLLIALVVAALINPLSAYAYIDPSVMTYTIQALASVAIVMASVFGVAWRRIKRALAKSLEIDEYRNKSFDSKVQQGSYSLETQATLYENKDNKDQQDNKTKSKEKFKLSFAKRFIFAFATTFFVCVSVLFFSSITIVMAQQNEFIAYSIDIMLPFFLVSLGLALVGALVLSIFRGRIFYLLCGLILAAGIACVIQRYALNINMPPLNGEILDLKDFIFQVILSTTIWLIIFAVITYIALKKPKFLQFVGAFSISVLLLIQIFSLAFALPEAISNNTRKDYIACTQNGMLELSPKQNVVVLILDTISTDLFDEVYSQDKSFVEDFDEFTIYNNTTCYFEYTRYASPFLLTSLTPRDTTSTNQMWTDGTKFVRDINSAGFDVGLYTLDFFASKSYFKPYVKNLEESEFQYTYDRFIPSLAKLAAFRDAPWLLKPMLVTDAERVNDKTAPQYTSEEKYYTGNDAQLYQELVSQNMTLKDDSQNGSFRYYHLSGVHPPITYLEDFSEDETKATEITEFKANMNLVKAYINELKRLGVYDNTMIIVTADHGVGETSTNTLDHPSFPIFFVKNYNTSGVHEKVKFSNIATGHQDYHVSVIDAVGADTSSYQGTVLRTLIENTNPRYFYKIHNPYKDGKFVNEDYFTEYVVKDGKDSRVLENWEETGSTYPIVYGW
ncbi:MAG: sulfatase-like hydrolase/transferase [Coriobacteriales bacterium]|nr:sulfatase-like hydrolase/transferase [Coriobacteriales bacterium]